jgi:hypothetical protein
MISNLVSETKRVLTSKAFLGLFVSLLVISLSMVYVASEPRPKERFLSISTLGSNMMAEDYYPNGKSIIDRGDSVNWYLNVYNRMGDVEYVSVRIKLLNSTDVTPNDSSNIPSPMNTIIEIKKTLTNNSTWTIPLNWSITEIDEVQNYNVIKSLDINGVGIDDINVKDSNGTFRMIVELWRYNTEKGTFSFAWSSGLDDRSAWNQIWFNVKQST